MTNSWHFDTKAEMQKIRGTPANPANVANFGKHDSQGSQLSQGVISKLDFSTKDGLDNLAGLGTTGDALAKWLWLVREAASKNEVFALLDRFRLVDWTDTQRAQMSRCYINQLSAMD